MWSLFSQPVSWDQDFITVKLHGWSNEDKLVSGTFPEFPANQVLSGVWRSDFGSVQDPLCLPQWLPLHKVEVRLWGHSRPTLPSPATATSQGYKECWRRDQGKLYHGTLWLTKLSFCDFCLPSLPTRVTLVWHSTYVRPSLHWRCICFFFFFFNPLVSSSVLCVQSIHHS